MDVDRSLNDLHTSLIHRQSVGDKGTWQIHFDFNIYETYFASPFFKLSLHSAEQNLRIEPFTAYLFYSTYFVVISASIYVRSKRRKMKNILLCAIMMCLIVNSAQGCLRPGSNEPGILCTGNCVCQSKYCNMDKLECEDDRKDAPLVYREMSSLFGNIEDW